MHREMLRLRLLCSSLRKIIGRRSSQTMLHSSMINTCCHQMTAAQHPTQYPLLPPACLLFLSTQCPSCSLQTARSPLMSSSWLLSKRQQKRARCPSAAPPSASRTNLLTHPISSSRHRLERGRKPPKLALTYLNRRLKPANSVPRSQSRPVPSVPVSGPPLCSSSRWPCTGSSPGSVSRSRWAP